MTKLTITKPDDWHIHLRQGLDLKTTVSHAAKQFHRVIAMPNTIPPIVDIPGGINYKKAILNNTPDSLKQSFNPLVTIYLTDDTTEETIKQASNHDDFIGAKLYPKGATTNSHNGVTDISKIQKVMATMEELNFPLLIHGEVTDDSVDVFDRETAFINNVLTNIRKQYPRLKIILEHVTTKDGIDFVLNNPRYTAATITPHHLLLNRNDLLVGGLRPHYYCLPIIKDKYNQDALIKAALSNNPCFFAGSDSAPHKRTMKESFCCPAGIYHGPDTTLVYAQFFDTHNKLENLEAFISFYGADFYNLPRNEDRITLLKQEYTIPDSYSYPDHLDQLIPFWAGKKLSWSYA